MFNVDIQICFWFFHNIWMILLFLNGNRQPWSLCEELEKKLYFYFKCMWVYDVQWVKDGAVITDLGMEAGRCMYVC